MPGFQPLPARACRVLRYLRQDVKLLDRMDPLSIADAVMSLLDGQKRPADLGPNRAQVHLPADLGRIRPPIVAPGLQEP